jgi:hypothetical protein
MKFGIAASHKYTYKLYTYMNIVCKSAITNMVIIVSNKINVYRILSSLQKVK